MADLSSKTDLPTPSVATPHSVTSSVKMVTPVIKSASKAKANVPTISSAKPVSVTSSSKPKYNDYRCYNVPEMKQLYVKMLNDNLLSLINYIYSQQSVEPYNSPATRVALSMQMLLASNQLIPYQQASAIIKDIEALRADAGYLDQWANASLKRKALMKEIEMVRKHTEIDDTISLNLANQPDTMGGPDGEDLKNFDMNSGISTLNVSAQMPVDNLDGDQGRCNIM